MRSWLMVVVALGLSSMTMAVPTVPTMVQIYAHEDNTPGASVNLVVLVKTADGKPVDVKKGLEEGDQIDLLQCSFPFSADMSNAEYIGTDQGAGSGGCLHYGSSAAFQSMNYKHLDFVLSDTSYDRNSSTYGAMTMFRLATVGAPEIHVSRMQLTSLAATPRADFRTERADHVYKKVAEGEIQYAKIAAKWETSTAEEREF